MATWNLRLFEARTSTGLTQKDLANRCGIAETTYNRYESGLRTPRREMLIAICERLEMHPDVIDEVLADAGYEPLPGSAERILERRNAGVASVREALESYSWSCLLTNEFFEICDWNSVALRVAELDFATFESNAARHFLRLAALPHFYRNRLQNWDELIGRMVGFWKESFDNPANAAAASAYFNQLVTDLIRDTPVVFQEVSQYWASVPPFSPYGRNAHPVRWRVQGDVHLSFDTVFRS